MNLDVVIFLISLFGLINMIMYIINCESSKTDENIRESYRQIDEYRLYHRNHHLNMDLYYRGMERYL